MSTLPESDKKEMPQDELVPAWLHRSYMRALEMKYYAGTEIQWAKLQYLIYRLGNKTDREPVSYRRWLRGEW